MKTDGQILLFGASNLWLSRQAALSTLRSRLSGYLEIGLANGPGRSYGLRAGNPLARYLPLSEVSFTFPNTAPIRLAFITDIGNDIAYAQPPERIVKWVETLVVRLRSEGFTVLIGGIPIESLSRIEPRLFHFLAKFYYSQGVLSKEKAITDLTEVEWGVLEMCRRYSLSYVPVNPDWYSRDRFHLKLGATRSYWNTLLQGVPTLTEVSTPVKPKTRVLFPERYWWLGKEHLGRGSYNDLVPDSLIFVK